MLKICLIPEDELLFIEQWCLLVIWGQAYFHSITKLKSSELFFVKQHSSISNLASFRSVRLCFQFPYSAFLKRDRFH